MHDVAWVSNPYSPFAPGDVEGGETRPEATAGDGGIVDGSGIFSREGGDGTKAPGLRTPAVTNRRTHRVARD